MEYSPKPGEPQMDQLISRAMRDTSVPEIPADFTDRLMGIVEKRKAARQVWNEFLIKTLIALALLILISGLIFLPEFSHQKEQAQQLLENRTLLIYAGIIILFTYTADQLILRYFLRVRKR